MKISKLKFSRSLTESPLSRYFSFSALYIAQGIPEGILFFAMPAWLAMNGKSATEIAAFIGVILIPWSFKLVVAPLMDRFTILSMGRKRPWVIFGQLGLILSFLSIGFVPDPLNNISGLMVVGFCISFFGAFQDVATDGMAVDVIPDDEKARANGLMWGTKIIGTSLSLLAGTYLINSLGFTTAISLLSIAVAIIMIVPIYFTERPGEKIMPWSKGEANLESKESQLRSWSEILKSLYRVTKLRSSLIFIVISFIGGILFGLMDTILPIFTIQELNWTNTEFSELFSIINIVAGIFGMLVGGYLVDYFGNIKMLTIYLGLTTVIITAFAFATGFWTSVVFICGFIFSYYVLYIFLTIAVFAAGMNLCWKTVAATQFTLYMALSNMGRALGSALVGVLKENFSWEYVFIFAATIPLLMGIMVQFINFKSHKAKVDSFKVLDHTLVAPHVIDD
ncbi:MFS transporter [Psychroserpens ponticola]|uniref:MFS transporter n=1 Tax=Psychroserpens ponticola TaxID=2932268 RepID=A0ABY7S012_9FLAO|nr:MFS transporter [Psychroserpens ponticola]WCO02729.1 MFS transporter [Psychroserpens ponticola]